MCISFYGLFIAVFTETMDWVQINIDVTYKQIFKQCPTKAKRTFLGLHGILELAWNADELDEMAVFAQALILLYLYAVIIQWQVSFGYEEEESMAEM